MRHLLTLLAALLLCASAQAQTVKALSYNTNGHVIYGGSNQLRFTNEVAFGPASGDVATITDQGFSFSSTNTNTSTTVFTFEDAGADKLRQNARENLGFSTNLNTLWTATNARTAARALSGSTNTNHPFSGTVSVVGTNNTNTLTFSNGILQSVQ